MRMERMGLREVEIVQNAWSFRLYEGRPSSLLLRNTVFSSLARKGL
jgi:hypothetical protein